MEDKRKECCKKPENLREPERLRDDLVFRRCKVCGCRHFELTLEPGHFDARMFGLEK